MIDLVLEKNYDFVIVLGLPPVDQEGNFVNFEQNLGGQPVYIGGEFRAAAVSAMYKLNPKSNFVMLAGLELGPDKEVIEKTMQMEQYFRTKHPDMKISRINSLPCTRHNLIALGNAEKQGVSLQNGKVAIVSNAYHESRIRAWKEDLAKKGTHLPEFDFVSPETVGIPEAASKLDSGFERRLWLESAGLEAINHDAYQDRCQKGLVEILKEKLGEEKLKWLLSGEERVKFLEGHNREIKRL